MFIKGINGEYHNTDLIQSIKVSEKSIGLFFENGTEISFYVSNEPLKVKIKEKQLVNTLRENGITVIDLSKGV